VVHRVKTAPLDEPVERGSLPVLYLLHRGPARASDLASHLGLDLSTVSRHVTALHRGGWVEKRPDPDDGRAVTIAITTSGSKALAVAMERRRDLLDTALASWSVADRDRLAQLLARLDDDLAEALQSAPDVANTSVAQPVQGVPR
jgi:DNA-binding MarR family transcriptional regulator